MHVPGAGGDGSTGAAPRPGFGEQRWDAPEPGALPPILLGAVLRKITPEPSLGEMGLSLPDPRWLFLTERVRREERGAMRAARADPAHGAAAGSPQPPSIPGRGRPLPPRDPVLCEKKKLRIF